jgi:hypothetical protein
MTKKAIIASAFVLAATIAIPVFAQTATTTSTTIAPAAAQQPILQVGAAGKVPMRGTIASVSTGSFTVTSWGGAWTVNVGSAAQILPVNGITQLKVGDFVGVQGTVSQSASWTIDATLVHDWADRAMAAQGQGRKYPRNYVGTASGVNGSSFTLSAAAGASYTVDVASGAKVVNTKWVTIPLASINSGDNVRVYGTNASGTITAQIVRDITISATSTTK